MNKHQGQIVEYIVRRNNYNISELASKLGINRRSLYNWFNSAEIKRNYILDIGGILRHDFSKEFPELFEPHEFQRSIEEKAMPFRSNGDSMEDDHWKSRYISLLEKYNDFVEKSHSRS